MTTECTCDPCTYRRDYYRVHRYCCMGDGVIDYDYDCPVSDHADEAIAQHGPRNQQEDQT